MTNRFKPTPATGEEAGTPFRPKRIAWVDVARGLGILLVMIGHSAPKAIPPLTTVLKWSYSFHMPLFFFLSGLMTKEDSRQLPWGQVASKAARSLMLPYALFGAISYLFWLFLWRYFESDIGASVPPLYPLAGLLYGVFDSPLTIPNATLWFFPCLFCTLLLHRSLPRNVFGEVVIVLFLFLAGVAFVKLCSCRLPWGLDIACLALLFLYVGQKLRPCLLNMSPQARMRCLLVVPVLLIFQVVCVVYNTRVDLARGLIGNPALFLPGALGGILATLFVAPYLPERMLGSFIGRNTIIIFPMHVFCFSAIHAAYTLIPSLRRIIFLSPSGTVAVYVIFTCFAFVVINPIMKALFPWLVPATKVPR